MKSSESIQDPPHALPFPAALHSVLAFHRVTVLLILFCSQAKVNALRTEVWMHWLTNLSKGKLGGTDGE